MAIFISKNAVSQNPLNEKIINVNDQKEKPLKSSVLDLPYLQGLASNDWKNKPITINNASNFQTEIIRIKMALNIIDNYIDIPGQIFNIPGGFFITNTVNSGVFDTHFVNAINEFQSFVGITVTGEIDSKTLSKIDLLLDPKVIYDRLNNKVIGKEAVSDVRIETNSDENGNYSYELKINGKSYIYTAPAPISITPIIPSQSNDSGDIHISLNDNPAFKKELLLQNNSGLEAEQELSGVEFGIFKNIGNLSLPSQPNVPLNNNSLQDELNLAPPRILPDKHARLHLVQDGDELENLISNEYYNNQPLSILDKYTESNNIIHTFPARTLNPNPATRKHDARYQFYLNKCLQNKDYENLKQNLQLNNFL